MVPQYHIPSRFVTIIPKEFNGSQPQQQSASGGKKKKSSESTVSSNATLGANVSKRTAMGGSFPLPGSSKATVHRRAESSDDALNEMLGALADDGLDNFDEFDLGFEENEELPPPSGVHM